ncbi:MULTISPECIES: hypothetical protein [Bifidobacterium]|uniref:YbjN domain-containing protein n=2 Tax=Bifidobacterium TaxID=1678 RepID=A0A430FC09_9BIFI|nr:MULTISPECIES: hypothetical protein [Bifidobacterium]MBT1177701.1 hypothetical protein [Bifidobacterium callimiconis]OXN00653.1 hypothetical protein Tam10B_1124 [Bifidobacterium vansinderenii]RSX50376.1 hypothetical protein D2E23_1699 [Bifidobacterium callimiconis]
MAYSTALYARVKEYLDSDGLHYDEDPTQGRFEFGINIHSKVRNVRVRIFVDDDNFSVVAVPQFGGDTQDPENMRALAEYTARANYGLVQGNFQFDFRDGEIRYWSAMLTDDDSLPSIHTIGRVVFVAIMMWERYGDGYLKVGLAGVDPETAVNEAENPEPQAPAEPSPTTIDPEIL